VDENDVGQIDAQVGGCRWIKRSAAVDHHQSPAFATCFPRGNEGQSRGATADLRQIFNQRTPMQTPPRQGTIQDARTAGKRGNRRPASDFEPMHLLAQGFHDFALA